MSTRDACARNLLRRNESTPRKPTAREASRERHEARRETHRRMTRRAVCEGTQTSLEGSYSNASAEDSRLAHAARALLPVRLPRKLTLKTEHCREVAPAPVYRASLFEPVLESAARPPLTAPADARDHVCVVHHEVDHAARGRHLRDSDAGRGGCEGRRAAADTPSVEVIAGDPLLGCGIAELGDRDVDVLADELIEPIGHLPLESSGAADQDSQGDHVGDGTHGRANATGFAGATLGARAARTARTLLSLPTAPAGSPPGVFHELFGHLSHGSNVVRDPAQAIEREDRHDPRHDDPIPVIPPPRHHVERLPAYGVLLHSSIKPRLPCRDLRSNIPTLRGPRSPRPAAPIRSAVGSPWPGDVGFAGLFASDQHRPRGDSPT